MRSGKKLDDEISKIESKIQQFEEEKRRLNIDFKPYSYSHSKSSSNLSKRSYTLDRNQRPSVKTETEAKNVECNMGNMGNMGNMSNMGNVNNMSNVSNNKKMADTL